ncbi:MAG: thioredoxin [Firmicutes bacterium]|nr:thioredoxin [Bacillota bacterium]
MNKQKLFVSPWFSCVILLLAVAFVAFGIYRGEMAVVVQKAINICLECIGIG